MANDATLTKPNPVERRAQIAARRAALPDEKRARLEQRLTTAPDHWKGLIPPARRDRPPLCSFAQERLWFVEQMEPDRSIYQVPVAVRVQGELSLPALEQSLSEIVRRHEILRTSFPEFEGRPVQKIADSLELNLQFFDLGRLAEQEREIAVKTLLSRYIARPLLLAEAPLFRVQIVRIACDEHVLILVMHHLISDGWSFQLLISELGLLYSHFSRGAAGVLPELPVQYADFAEWQRQELAGEKVESDLSLWKRQLKDIPSALDLPFDRPRPTFLSHQGSTIDIVLEKELSDRLRRACQDQGITRFIMLLASFQALLSRYSGQEDLTVGTPVAGRNVQLERLIGLFVNTLVMRVDLSGNPTVHEFLMQVKETWLQAQQHQDLPFEKLVEELRPQ